MLCGGRIENRLPSGVEILSRFEVEDHAIHGLRRRGQVNHAHGVLGRDEQARVERGDEELGVSNDPAHGHGSRGAADLNVQ